MCVSQNLKTESSVLITHCRPVLGSPNPSPEIQEQRHSINCLSNMKRVAALFSHTSRARLRSECPTFQDARITTLRKITGKYTAGLCYKARKRGMPFARFKHTRRCRHLEAHHGARLTTRPVIAPWAHTLLPKTLTSPPSASRPHTLFFTRTSNDSEKAKRHCLAA